MLEIIDDDKNDCMEGYDTSIDIIEEDKDLPRIGDIVSVGKLNIKIKMIRVFGNIISKGTITAKAIDKP